MDEIRKLAEKANEDAELVRTQQDLQICKLEVQQQSDTLASSKLDADSLRAKMEAGKQVYEQQKMAIVVLVAEGKRLKEELETVSELASRLQARK
ncbi:MAG: hypothetical protein Q9217_003181 [Psora testacea]